MTTRFMTLVSNQSKRRSIEGSPAIAEEVEALSAYAEDPLDILIRLEEEYGTVTDEDLELVYYRK